MALALGVLVGCYDLPKPECGFACGPASECPSDYTCNPAVNRCVLDGTTPTCASAVDAGTDTGDLTAPHVVSQIPQPGSNDASLDVIVMARFDEPVVGVSASTFRLEQNGAPVPGTVTYVPTIDSANFEPDSPLLPATLYTAIVTTGITDLAGNPLAAEIAWQFATAGDAMPPVVVTRSPGVDATGVDVGAVVVAEFDEPVFGVSASSFTLTQGVTAVAGVVTYDNVAYRATFRPALQLAAHTLYTAWLSINIYDASFNSLDAVTWSFTTGPDTLGPRVVVTSPLDLSTAVPTTTAITVQFDEPVQDVTTTSFTVNGGAITGTIALSAGDTVATFTPDAALPAGATISVTLTTAITDTAANALAAPVAFSFMTAP